MVQLMPFPLVNPDPAANPFLVIGPDSEAAGEPSAQPSQPGMAGLFQSYEFKPGAVRKMPRQVPTHAG